MGFESGLADAGLRIPLFKKSNLPMNRIYCKDSKAHLVMKQLKHAYATLIDLPEALPFGSPPEELSKLSDMEAVEKKEAMKEKELFAFVKKLGKFLGERTCFIGEDIIGEKFYKRFLFEKGGFIELMTGEPVAISAHFTSKARAQKFASALSKSLKGTVKKAKLLEILDSSTVVDEEEAYKLTYEKWEKLKEIRGD